MSCILGRIYGIVTLHLFATYGFPPTQNTNVWAAPILICIFRFGPAVLLTTAQTLLPPAVFEHEKYYTSPGGLCQAKPSGRYNEMSELRLAVSRFGLGAWPGRFHSDSGWYPGLTAHLSPSLCSKLPYAPILRASFYTNFAALTFTPGPMVAAATQLLIY